MKLEEGGGGRRRYIISSIVVSDKLAFTALSSFNLLRQTCVTLVKSAVKPSPEMHAAFKIQLHTDSDSISEWPYSLSSLGRLTIKKNLYPWDGED